MHPAGGSFVPEMGRERILNRGARVPARHEQVCNVDLARRSIGPVLGFGKDPADAGRGRDPSLPLRAEKKSCSDRSAVVYLVGHDS